MQYTDHERDILAEIERDMDEGRQPYVWFNGVRKAVDLNVLAACGIQNRQTVTLEQAQALRAKATEGILIAIAEKEARDGATKH